MKKKFTFLLPLLMLLPFALSGLNLTHHLDEVTTVQARTNEERGEYHGYTYTEYDYYSGRRRDYDTPDLAPTIVQTFWAPTGYKCTLNFSDEQIDEILYQADGVGATYGYVDFMLYYTKFGMKVYIDSLIYDFSDSENPKQDCKDWVMDKINNFEPFYEVAEASFETAVSFILEFDFVTHGIEYLFAFETEVVYVEPFDESSFIQFDVQYFQQSYNDEKRIDIHAEPVVGFFNDPAPYDNEFGYKTDETMERWIHDDMVENACKFDLTLYAYGVVEIGNMDGGHLEMSYPNYHLPVKIKMSFVVGGVSKSIWSKEFDIGDPEICVTIDGYNDRTTVQRDSEHEYDVQISDNNVTEDNEIYYYAEASIYPSHLDSAYNVEEHYDIAIAPDRLDNYCLIGTFNEWNYPSNYVFVQDLNDSNHFVLENIYLEGGTQFSVRAANWENYENHTTWEGCGYALNAFGSMVLDSDGYYDIDFYLEDPEPHDEGKDNHIRLNILSTGSAEEPTKSTNYYLVGSFNNWQISDDYKLNSDSGDTNHYSMDVSFNEGDALKISDENGNLITNRTEWQCCGFTLDASGNVVVNKTGKYFLDFYIQSSRNANIILRTNVFPDRPKWGHEKFLIYIASNEEVRLYDDGEYEILKTKDNTGTFYIWDKTEEKFVVFEGIKLFEYSTFDDPMYSPELEGENVIGPQIVKIPYAGTYRVHLHFEGQTNFEMIHFESDDQFLEVSASDASADQIVLTSGKSEVLPDDINIFLGGESLDITPSVDSEATGVKYYFYWGEPSKEGIVDIKESANGKLTITPLSVGIVEKLTLKVECELFKPITRTISIRVLDAIYDVAKISVPNEFHQAGKPLTASIDIRGFTGIQNIDIEWTAKTKDGKELEADKQFTVNGDASMTINKPESDDYTITASYQGVQLDSLTVQVRYTDLNKFLKVNVWWIFLMTIALVVFVVVVRKIFKRGRTTVENIERAYDVFCKCLSDDRLTLSELKTIKREIARCMHRCEDLNIEAFNQYEKSIRYLRKSLADTNALIKKWDTISVEDKSAYIEKLNMDFNKALNVAREIENAKELVEQYHMKANRKNYETIVDDEVGAKGNKSKL